MAIYNGRILMRRGLEADFDASKLMAGEWALSTDKGIVRICYQAGKVIRMATYEAFEEDMKQIEDILLECQSIEEAVTRINAEIDTKVDAVVDYVGQAKQYRDEALRFRNEAEQFAPEGYADLIEQVQENTVKVDTIIEKADLGIKETASGEEIHLTDSAEGKAVEFALFGKATQDGEPTPENPIEIEVSGESGSITVLCRNSNLIPFPYANGNSMIENGLTFNVNEDDGSVTVNGTATKETFFDLANIDHDSVVKMYLPKGKVHISGIPSGTYGGSLRPQFWFRNAEKTLKFSIYAEGRTVDVPKSDFYYIGIDIVAGNTLTNFVVKPMVNVGETALPYEKPSPKNVTIPTDGLAGIKVDSGGNYTDQNGQQWICDEIVKYADGSGEKIQRINKETFSIDDNWETTTTQGRNAIRTNKKTLTTDYSWNGKISNIATSIYIGDSYCVFETSLSLEEFKIAISDLTIVVYQKLAEPIRTTLTAEELAEISTFYPVTNISNDFDCGMKVKYNCDSKNYIDNKIALLTTAMVNSI